MSMMKEHRTDETVELTGGRITGSRDSLGKDKGNDREDGWEHQLRDDGLHRDR